MLTVISLFSGAGGLDKAFELEGFKTLWANEYDKKIYPTFKHNFPTVGLDTRSITEIQPIDIPLSDGIIGGPPCQSWSEGGAGRGIEDNRGKLFLNYIAILEHHKPKFFLIENVEGMLNQKHKVAFDGFVSRLEQAGYIVSIQLLNANEYGVPQDRKRLFFIGFRQDLGIKFEFPKPTSSPTLKDSIWDLKDNVVSAINKTYTNPECKVLNHEYMLGGFSSMYMSRNRVRAWDEPSFTIQATARHIPLHPQAPKMIKVDKDKMKFDEKQEHLYRRLSIRECARIQTFPDDFEFIYDNLVDGYKMVGNAVPVNLARVLAKSIKEQLLIKCKS